MRLMKSFGLQLIYLNKNVQKAPNLKKKKRTWKSSIERRITAF